MFYDKLEKTDDANEILKNSIRDTLPFTHPVTKPNQYYKYALTGIVAHIGIIDRGHYYSFIKYRESENWLEFNDREVLPFSPEMIPKECFGGLEDVRNANGPNIMPRFRENNEYLLVYERKTVILFNPVLVQQSPGRSI